MSYNYYVQCWIRPKSGIDLARKNRIMNLFKEFMSQAFPDDEKLENALSNFEDKREGLILEPFFIESDKKITDGEKELMPEIRKNHSEAKLESWEIIPTVVHTNHQ